jgi:hypothetical protein
MRCAFPVSLISAWAGPKSGPEVAVKPPFQIPPGETNEGDSSPSPLVARMLKIPAAAIASSPTRRRQSRADQLRGDM